MSVDERISIFSQLGVSLHNIDNDEFQTLAMNSRNENGWFTEANVRMAFKGIVAMLEPAVLKQWMAPYSASTDARKVAIIMAGNIPMVGFHDLLCTLLAGHHALVKLSSKDKILMRFIVSKLIEIEPRLAAEIEIADQLKGFDAVIATGSDNTSRYFDYYFGKYPNIIRKNRTSVAVINGSERDDELTSLGVDVFSYFGLGCRNVSKVYLPEGFGPERLLKSWESFREWESASQIIHHPKYFNNYEYQKSILLVTGTPFLDNGCVMTQESKKLVSPIAVLYYENYNDRKTLEKELSDQAEKIQCVVENTPGSKIKFGQSQFPFPWDYADQIDTLKFLSGLR